MTTTTATTDMIECFDRTVLAAFLAFEETIGFAISRGFSSPALVLTYSAIDIAGSLEEGRATKRNFIRWVEKYLLPDSDLPCTAEEVWGARCGLVHTHTAESATSRGGTIRQIYYSNGVSETNRLRDLVRLRTSNIVVVDVEAMVHAFRTGLRHFVDEIKSDRTRLERVYESAQKILRFSSQAEIEGIFVDYQQALWGALLATSAPEGANP